jgi:putative DNA primase/helicase
MTPDERRQDLAQLFPELDKTPLVSPIKGVMVKNDTWAALQFLEAHQADVRYCFPWKCWMLWNGQRWVRDEKKEVLRLIHQTLLKIQGAIDLSPDPKKFLAWIKQAWSISGLKNIAEAAQPFVPVLPDEFDADIWLLNTPDGTVDLRTGILHGHRREDYCTKMTAVGPKAGPMPLFEKFLDWVSLHDPILAESFQTLFGYCATGSTAEHIMVLAYGTGANGKSTLFGLIQYLFGDYGTTANTSILTGGKSVANAATPDLAQLIGKRLAIVSESTENARLSVEMVKKLASGDRLFVRRLYEEGFTFTPQATVFLHTNHLPDTNIDHGIIRRTVLWPFSNQIPQEDRDPRLGEKLQTEAAAILAWIIDGCLLWQKKGLTICERSAVAAKQYWDSMDVLGQFLQNYVFEKSATITKGDLYIDYARWCEAGTMRPKTHPQFNRAFQERHPEIKDRRTGQVRFWIGLARA